MSRPQIAEHPILGMNDVGFCRLVHAFTCAGMLPRQYMNFALFADSSTELLRPGMVACTKIVLPQVIARGLNITEVAHDYQATIKLYVRQLGMVNSYDTWHVASYLCRYGPYKDRTWFTELSDKGMYFLDILIKMEYLAIQQGAPRVITKVALLRVPVNSQVTFQKRKPLTMPAAISAYEAALRKTLIYKNADSCHLCRDTYWVESFNHQLLTYLPKRIHFHTKTFEMRMNLAVMDWNENCQRMATSHHEYTDVRRPDHHSTYNVLVKKTYRFVNNIWSMYVLRNITSQQILQDDEDDDEMVLPDDAAMYDGDYVDSEDDDYVCSEDDLEPWLQLALDGLV
eukprot:Em0477g2a